MAKETSGLLMNVIGTLSSLQSNEQRDREKAKLEREFKLSDQRLEKLVSTNHKELASVMQIYGKVSSRINDARTRIAMVKGQVAACRGLLHCRRDELKKLWLEGVEHKEVLLLLNQIQNLKNIPEQINEHIGKKNYVAAAQLVVKAEESLHGPLSNVEGLKEVRSDLAAKQERFYRMLLEDLCHYLYVKPSNDVVLWRRTANSQTPFQRASSGRGSSGRASGNIGLKSEAPKVKSLTLEIAGSHQTSQDDSSCQAISSIIQCLALLKRLPDALENLKSSMGKEMTSVTAKTAQQVSEMYPSGGNKNVLKELFEAVMEQMRRIVAAHTVVLDSVKKLASEQRNSQELALYTKEDVWSQVQNVIQVLLSQYWNMGHSSSGTNSTGGFPSGNTQMAITDLNAYFSKRKPPRPQKSSLFRFEGSLHSLSLNETGSSNKPLLNGADGGDRALIVEPNARLVIEIYQPLMAFVEEIETALGCSQGEHCALHVFVTVFTRDVFLSQIHIEMGTALDEATRKLDMWKSVGPNESLHNLKATRPLLQSTVQVQKCMGELRQLMEALPQFSQHFLGMACNMLLRYCETCQAAYRGLVHQPDSEDKRVISATWAKDEDIHRFLRSLPSWTALQTVRARRNTGNTDGETYEDSPEEVKQRSAKETEILTGNLGDAIIPPNEILADHSQLRVLALLQESLEWFAGHIQEFASVLTRPSSSSEPSLATMPESNIQTLVELAKDFEDLADTCLLVLHLEVRVHCFFHLVPLGRQAQFWFTGDNHEPDPEIVRLSRDLTSIDESLVAFLQPRKHRYIFEGVSHLVASIIMSCVQHIRRMNENGVKKMCRNIFSLQQTLTSITSAREPALDYARQYFELLCLTPEEILNGILERGSQYTELEYIQILQLLNRSRPGTASNEITRHLERLSEILGELGVTV